MLSLSQVITKHCHRMFTTYMERSVGFGRPHGPRQQQQHAVTAQRSRRMTEQVDSASAPAHADAAQQQQQQPQQQKFPTERSQDREVPRQRKSQLERRKSQRHQSWFSEPDKLASQQR